MRGEYFCMALNVNVEYMIINLILMLIIWSINITDSWNALYRN